MVDFFDKLYYIANKEQILFLRKTRMYSLFRFLIRRLSNVLIPFYYNLTTAYYKKGTSTDLVEGKQLIVSLTSFPARIDNLWIVVESILRQNKKPNKIVLWLSKEQFIGEEVLPKKLIKQKQRGLEIEFVDGDIRSHKKYYYAVKYFPNELLLTIDDDIIYRTNFIESLVKLFNSNSNNVIANYCKKIAFDQNQLLTYSNWPNIDEKKIDSENLFFGTGGGVIFPIEKLSNLVNDKKLFLELTPTADDIWLNSIVKFSNLKVSCSGNRIGFLPIINKINDSLHNINNVNNQNDIQIKKIVLYFNNKYNLQIFKNK